MLFYTVLLVLSCPLFYFLQRLSHLGSLIIRLIFADFLCTQHWRCMGALLHIPPLTPSVIYMPRWTATR